MSTFRFRLVLALAGAVLLPLAGCDSAEDDTPAGSYEATRFRATIEGETVDVLAAGGALTMRLRDDGTVSGRLVVPTSLAEGGEGDVPFAGTYTVTGSGSATTVTFEHEADTFVRDAEWAYDDGRLETDDSNLSVVLERD